jgi:hypothetical protein
VDEETVMAFAAPATISWSATVCPLYDASINPISLSVAFPDVVRVTRFDVLISVVMSFEWMDTVVPAPDVALPVEYSPCLVQLPCCGSETVCVVVAPFAGAPTVADTHPAISSFPTTTFALSVTVSVVDDAVLLAWPRAVGDVKAITVYPDDE